MIPTALPKKNISAASSSRNTTPTSTPSTNSPLPFVPHTPCPPLTTPNSQTPMTCSCAAKKSAPAPNVFTIAICSPAKCVATILRLILRARVRRIMSIVSSMDVRRMREVGLDWRGLFSFGWGCRIFGCVVCSLGIHREWLLRWSKVESRYGNEELGQRRKWGV